MSEMSELTDSEVINQLGGTGAVAALCGVRPNAVSQWRNDGIPAARRYQLAETMREREIGIPTDFFERSIPARRPSTPGEAA